MCLTIPSYTVDVKQLSAAGLVDAKEMEHSSLVNVCNIVVHCGILSSTSVVEL